MDAFRRGLQDNGYVEGQNISLESRWADGEYERIAVAQVQGRNGIPIPELL